MAYRGSAYFKGNTRLQPPKAQVAGTNAIVFFTHVFDKELVDTTDVLELFPVPAGARVAAITYCSTNLPAGNMSLGWMSGVVGARDDARTSGTEFVSAVAHATTDISVALALLQLQARQSEPRSIGWKTSVSTGAVNANKTFTIRVELQF